MLVWGLTIVAVAAFALGALNWFVWKRRTPAWLFGRPDRLFWVAILGAVAAQLLAMAGLG